MAHVSASEQLARINPDSKPVLYLVLAVTTVIAAVAFAVSFAGLAAVSQWAQIPPRLSWALPVFIDGAILGFTVMILVFRARGESTIFAWVVLIAFTVISVGANAAHAYADGTTGHWQTVVGAGLAGLAPAGLAVFIHGIARLLVATPERGPMHAKGVLVSSTNEEDMPHLLVGSSGHPDPLADLRVKTTDQVVDGSLRDQALPTTYRIDEASDVGRRVSAPRTQRDAPIARTGRDARSDSSQLRQVLALRSEGKTQQEIADQIGVSRATVGRWVRAHRRDVGNGAA